MKLIQSVKMSLTVIALGLASCSPKVENRGYVKQANWKDTVKVGQTTKQEVLDQLGSPSAKSSFGPETWYYVSSRKESVAFLKPEVVEQETADISFDGAGVVSSINIYNKDNAREIDLVKRTTPTEGHSMSFIDQALGNLGRFNKPGNSDSVVPGRRPTGRGGF
jgi:outer membrane protein assembly factor BamE (lipoprotein component of BamABCDE complex)